MRRSKKYNIFQAKETDKTEIIQFIKKHWSENHIFVKNKKLFLWQYLDGDLLNFIIAKNIKKGSIYGILGYIPTKKYDPLLKDNDHWGAIWKIKESAPLGLGLILLNYLNNSKENTTYAAIGISDIAKKIYIHLKYKVGTLNHYYCVNSNKVNMKIAHVDKKTNKKKIKNNFIIKEIDELEKRFLKYDFSPVKSIKYFINRYKNHPIYTYNFFGIYKMNKLVSIWVIRKQYLKSSCCLRIVDMYGSLDNVESLYIELQKLLENEKAEYIDCLNYGILESIFSKIGFEKLDLNGSIIIPNYFEPFLKKNIEIGFAIKSNYENYVIFKGDSDQDRPSINT